MNTPIKQLSIIGPTASGKSDLAIKVAQKIDAYILSIDSLSIYKEIDIVSAKPSKDELQSIKHFGIDELYPDEYFSVEIFINLYKQVKDLCQNEGKNLIIVGGTSFYLMSLLSGLSALPNIDAKTSSNVKNELEELTECYDLLYSADYEYMKNISPNDSYRIEKALLIYRASGLAPSEYFRANPPKPIIENLDIYNIYIERNTLRERIKKRTNKMLDSGLIDEICYLEQKYTRSPHSMNAIGIVEVLDYLDGKITKEKMSELISTHTSQLAKRQQTFNRTQFENVRSAKLNELEDLLL
ncbi:MAG: tRNA (adenosine(37)-N6)-dimethylallyltransferase MiaA [Sulfurimonas sp.]|uniref:tRNA (adenosine(37)-N6)-dimethylallyltransferase MiaA n=1 Tax=Sulfurimonas sp. TaxID=2022749 RepID=UPI0025E545E1|nr:tRNA (adenosine(37)-N6)-dimethylallyltransferase MiaA [Sulfurimonas sp.]MCK9492444.1 tRNA (adenosine(37)-N6)-dimethylallyltransferase MiaA [Sulfurimonas sp.]